MKREIVAIKIGRKNFKVRYLTLPKDYGKMSYSRVRIDIDDCISDNKTAITLLHEILHAIWAQRKLGNCCREERAVRELALGLIEIFVDNPGLCEHFEYLSKESR